ncbi:carboxypeptidase regulatory-like domain-containing protein [Mucilaginibacter robiniae]|uniref:Carboxypeptidase regulatory-like domain-containing protein n=1 Tax=Mucilaginibacter robiniae TaxID=2728022 RepID=A0A7L5E3Y6_9SPHI|nr:carboxypeptidase-like regulatory domain-containing protein [Mucilaginibacter robiniae]QJD96989.1 carboxypeptidase regulatory-like domain-containing protein [Mucilaginibacter robiniae]
MLLCLSSRAQVIPKVNCSFEKDTVDIAYASTFTNKLHVRNSGHTVIHLTKQTTSNLGALITTPDTIILQPLAERTFPVKYFSSKESINSKLQPFTVRYVSSELNAKPVQATFYSRLTEPEQLFMQATDPIIYIDPETQQVAFHVKVINRGYTASAVKISIQSASEALWFNEPVQKVEVEPETEHLVTFKASLLAKKISHADLQVNINMENQAGKSIGSRQINVVLLSSNKSLAGHTNELTPDNTIGLTSVSGDNARQYMLRGNGNLKLSADSKLNYNLNANYYNTESAFDLRDTYIGFENKNLALKAGTIAENLEMPLYGRGFKASGTVDKSTVNLYYVNNAYLLYSNVTTNQLTHAPNTWAGSYEYRYNKDSFFEATYIHQDDDLHQLKTDLTSVNGHIQLNKTQALNVTAGYSTESNTATLQNKMGYAAGFNYSGSFNKFDLVSDNFISSAYYSGLRRGTLQLNEQLSYPLSATIRLVARYTKLENNPSYLGTNVFAAAYNNLNTYEMAASIRAGNHFFISLRPYLQQQSVKSIQFSLPSLGEVSALAHRLAMDLRYTFPDNSTLSMNTDYGMMYNQQLHTKQPSLRVTLNYYAGLFGLNAFALTGPYYLLDQYYLLYNQYNTNYSVAPYVNFSFFKHRLNLNLSNSFNYSKSYVGTFTNGFSGLTKVNLPGNWALSAQVYYNQYSGYNRYQSQLGVLKSFAVTGNADKHKLELCFFEDDNGNGIQDEHESIKPGVLVSVDNNMAQSNEHGKVVYTDIASGLHHVQLVDAKGWSCSTLNDILLHKNIKYPVALTRNVVLTGRIQLVKQKYQQSAVVLEGIRITARDMENRTYFTLTDEQGQFSLSLPVNQYTISTNASGQNYTITNPSQTITLTKDKADPVTFTLIDHSQKVEVRRF